VKFNPSTRQENVYRLFTNTTSTDDGRKIPYLSKAMIFKLMKSIGKTKSVSVYIQHPNIEHLTCEFDEKGNVYLSAMFDTPVELSFVNTLFQTFMNPVINDVKTILEQNGYVFHLFSSLESPNIEVIQMDYETTLRVKSDFNLSKIKRCMSSIFISEINRVKNYVLRFKRVSNFNVFTSQEVFVLEKASQHISGQQIIHELLENYPNELDEAKARELVTKIANELQVEHGVRKSDIKIKDNPGFRSSFVINNLNILTINIRNINDLLYLQTLPIYLDTFIRMTQEDKMLKNVFQMCHADEEIMEVRFIPEKTLPVNVVNEVEEKHFPEKEAYNLFFNDEDDDIFDDEGEGINTTGGNGDSDSSVDFLPNSSSESIESVPISFEEESLPQAESLSDE
jgi:hypothetical protein